MKQKRYFQLPAKTLTSQTLDRGEGILADNGALVIDTGKFTGRSPDDKFIVMDDYTADIVDWNKFNNPISPRHFLALKNDVVNYLEQQPEIWTRYAFASSRYSIGLHLINEFPAHNLFALNLFIEPSLSQLETMEPEWTIYHAPGFKADPDVHSTRSSNFTVISFTRKIILIGGTSYTGEIKKSIFTMLNFILPLKHQILSMHCSANEDQSGKTTLFFGLSGTGKTTLSSDSEKFLIGDDEHGWDNEGIFNFEGGCYAKVIDLSPEKEPAIFEAIKPGALVENTTFIHGTNQIDFSGRQITENTRVSYPLSYMKNLSAKPTHRPPANVIFLTCDAYGVLPPICKLTEEQAVDYYLKGYTAKIAGTENLVREPKATFSACFGAPFLPLKPSFYATIFKNKLKNSGAHIWMVNTGWVGGSYPQGNRISLAYTRTLISAAVNGEFEQAGFDLHPVFNTAVPVTCPGIPNDVLQSWKLWPSEEAYLSAANLLLKKFNNNEVKEQESMVVA